MTYFVKIPVCVASWLVGGSLAYAGETAALQDPYATIAARNVFSLQAMRAEPPVPQATAPLPKIILKGMMTILGPEHVLFSVVRISPGSRPSESHYVLVEGEHQDGIEVVRIERTTGAVIFNNHGTVQRVSWTDSSVDASAKARSE